MPADCVSPGPALNPWALVRSRGGLNATFPFTAERMFAFGFGRTAIWHGIGVLGLREGDEVLVPAYNCGSELDPLATAGLKLVLYPLDAELNAQPEAIASLISPRTKALLMTHFFGFPQRHAAEVATLCAANGVAVIEDCAHGLLGAYPDGRSFGSLGDIAIFSFRKTLNVGDGAALVLNRADLPDPVVRLHRPVLPRAPARWRVRDAAAHLARMSAGRRWRGRSGGGIRNSGGAAAGPWFAERYKTAGMSRWTSRQIEGIAPAPIVAARRRNFLAVLASLPATPELRPIFTALPTGTVPMAFPLVATHPGRLVAELARRGVPAMRWWRAFHPACSWEGMERERYLKHHVVAIGLNRPVEPARLSALLS